jgi:hypothetical protein
MMNLANILNDITLALNILNSEAPNIAKVIELLKGSQTTIQQLLADANAVEQADLNEAQTELGQ